MARYAIIRNSKVENVVEWDGGGSWTPPADATTMQTDAAQPGDDYDGATFTRPPPPVPKSVTPLQIRRVLRNHMQAAAIRTWFLSLTANQKEDWQFASQVTQTNAIMAALKTQFSLTDAQMDTLFRQAGTESQE